MSRFLVLLLTVMVANMFGQPGVFGPVSTQLKAGDFAPDIVFTEVLSAAGAEPWSNANLTGRLTVLTILPPVSPNLQAVSRWNALVEQFRDKAVQFVWVASEYQPPLGPWLEKHPVKGWLLLDPLGATGLAYGMEEPAAILIGSDRRILGFDRRMVPDARTISAALEGRITTEPALVESGKVLLQAESPRMPRPEDHRPDFLPSYTLHVSPAGSESGGEYGGDDFWSFQGLDLKDVLTLLYDTTPVRIQLPAALDDGKRYDIAMVLPRPESKASIYNRILRGIEEHFQITLAHDERLMDVYVVTAGDGRPPAAKARPDDGAAFSRSSTSSVGFQVTLTGSGGGIDELGKMKTVGLADIRSISLEGTVDDFCRTLEQQLDRPVVNETGLEGEFAFRVKAGKGAQNDFLERVREQLHLSVAPAQRRVQVVAVKAR